MEGLLECDTEKYKIPAEENIQFFNAAKCGDILSVKSALTKHANINSSDKLGQSALMWACWNGNEEVVKYLLDFDAKQRTEKSKKNKQQNFLNYKAESKEKYNPLFCLIMSNSMQSRKSLECIKKIISNEEVFEKNFSLLKREDSFGENVLHKAVRSGNEEILNFFIKKLSEKKLLKDFIERKNSSSETPLILAIKLQQDRLAEILIENGADILVSEINSGTEKSISVLSFNEGKGNFQTFLIVMKAKLKYAIEEEKLNNKETERKYPRVDEKLKQELEKFNADKYYWNVYNKFSSGEINSPDELDDDVYKNIERNFFTLIQKTNMTDEDIMQIKQLVYKSPYLLQTSTYFDRNRNEKKSALQIILENGNIKLFKILFNSLSINNIPSVSSGYSDYLVCAILNNQPQIIEFLLNYSKNSPSLLTEKIMSPIHNFDPDLIQNSTSEDPTGIPLVQFLRTQNLYENQELLKKTILYYKSQFSNTNYSRQIYEEALNHCNENLILLLYESSKEKNDFYLVDTVKSRPIQFILLEKKYYKALEEFFTNGNFNKRKFSYTDKNGKTFLQELNKHDIKTREHFTKLLQDMDFINNEENIS